MRLPAVLAALGITVAFTLKHRGTGLVVLLLLELAVAAASLVVIWRGRTRLRFTVEGDRLSFTGRFTQREVSFARPPGRVVELKIVWWGTSRTPLSLWALIDADGACEAAVNAGAFNPAELERLRLRLGLEREVIETPINARDARDAYPGVIPWWLAHVVGLGVLVFVAAVVVVAVAQSA